MTISDDRFDAIVIGDGARGEVETAIELSGGRLLARIAWADVPGELGRRGGRPILFVEAEGAGNDALAAALPRIDTAALTLDLSVIVALDEAQIDLVTAALLGARVQLLCSPTLADRVAAIAIAVEVAARTVLHDRLGEGEALRLARLNAEVARIADVLARLSRDDPGATALGWVEDRRPTFGIEPDAAMERVDAQDIRHVIRSRRLRDKQFGTGLFEDPAWDMMLDLFAAHLERAQVSVSSLCIAAAVAPTTALRWIARMTEAGLFERQPDPFDRRRAFMVLSKSALEGMRVYVALLRSQGLPIT